MQVFTGKMRELYTAIGMDMMTTGACRRLRGEDGGGRGGNGGGGNGGGGNGGGANRQNGGANRQGNAGGQGGAQLQPSPEMGGQRQRPRTGLVFVAEGATFHPRIVQLGQANFDYTEVISGLKEGEKVAMLASLALQVQRQQQNDRNRQNANPLGGAQPGPGRGPGGPGGGGPGGGGGGGGAGGRGGGRG
jgi:HlyD family secretion protein